MNQNKKILQGAGTISSAEMEAVVGDIYDKFNLNRIKYDALLSDRKDIEEMEGLETKLKNRTKNG